MRLNAYIHRSEKINISRIYIYRRTAKNLPLKNREDRGGMPGSVRERCRKLDREDMILPFPVERKITKVEAFKSI